MQKTERKPRAGSILAGVLFAIFLILPARSASAELIPSLELKEQFDSNIFQEEANEESDFISVIMASLEFMREGTRLNSRARYDVQMEYFPDHTELNDWNLYQNFDGALSLNLQKGARIELLENLSYTPEQAESLGQSSVGDILGEGVRTFRYNSVRNVFGVRLVQPVTPIIALDAGYRNGSSTYRDPTRVDSRRHQAEARVAYGRNLWLVPSLRYRYEEIRFETDHVARTQDVSLGISHATGPAMSMDLTFGRAFPKTETEQWIASLSLLRKQVTGSWKILYSRQVGSSGDLVGELSTSDRFAASITRSMTRNLTATVNADYSLNQSITGNAVDIQGTSVSLEADYRWAPHISINLGCTLFRQTSDGTSGHDIDRNVVFFSVTIE